MSNVKSFITSRRNAYTLIEIIVTVIVLTVGFLGILASFNFSSKATTVSDKKLLAAQKGKELLENLRAKVDQRTWNSTWPLTCPGANLNWPGNLTHDGLPITYTCSNHSSGARQVTIRVQYND